MYALKSAPNCRMRSVTRLLTALCLIAVHLRHGIYEDIINAAPASFTSALSTVKHAWHLILKDSNLLYESMSAGMHDNSAGSAFCAVLNTVEQQIGTTIADDGSGISFGSGTSFG